jgi:hypothetical protein
MVSANPAVGGAKNEKDFSIKLDTTVYLVVRLADWIYCLPALLVLHK